MMESCVVGGGYSYEVVCIHAEGFTACVVDVVTVGRQTEGFYVCISVGVAGAVPVALAAGKNAIHFALTVVLTDTLPNLADHLLIVQRQ